MAADRTREIGVQAYIYAYPLVLMEITRRVSTNVEAVKGVYAPMNQFVHLRAFPDHTFREVVRPNADTLYSIFWFDVSKEPQILSIADTGGRYYMLPMLDMWTDVIASPGNRTTGTKEANYAIVGPNWQGTLPDGVEPIRATTNMGWVIGRTQSDGKDDYENVHKIPVRFRLRFQEARRRHPYLVAGLLDLDVPGSAEDKRRSAESLRGVYDLRGGGKLRFGGVVADHDDACALGHFLKCRSRRVDPDLLPCRSDKQNSGHQSVYLERQSLLCQFGVSDVAHNPARLSEFLVDGEVHTIPAVLYD